MTGDVTYSDREELMDGITAKVAGLLRAAIAARGAAALAVPGGATPAPFLGRLAEADLDWAKVTVMLTDERLVEPDSERANTRLLKATLLKDRASAARFLPWLAPGILERPEHALPSLVQAVEAVLPLDVCVLGMGADMHVASLFPGADRLGAALSGEAPPLMVLRAPGAPEARLTLTLPALAGARDCLLLIAGAEKKAALARARSEGPVEQAPVRAVLPFAEIHYAP